MEGLDSAASVYSEAKGEYTKQLTLFIVPVFHRFFMTCLQQAATEEPLAKRQLWKFQELLSQVPEWNVDKVQREVGKLSSEIQCDYLEELVTAVFIAHTKVLTAIRIGNKNKRVQITIPKLEHFLHRALSECSRLLWSSAYLFHADLPPMEKQKNHRQVEQLLHEGIAQAIRGLLPVKNILKDYLAEPEEEEEKDDKEDDDKEDEKEDEKEEKEEPKVEVKEEPKEEPIMVKDEPKPEPVREPKVDEPKEEPVPEVKPVPVIKLDEPPAQSAQIAQPPTFVVQTEPSVQFTDFNQVIQQRGNQTHIDYVQTTHEPPPEDNGIEFLDEESEPLSDVEDLNEPPEPLSTDDFETLP